MKVPEYDVAISFLTADEAIAAALHKALSDGLKVFFYPRSQEHLAGKDGLEAMRTPFLECRLMVVLYRTPWGETPWTGVEQTAIQERCLNEGWQRLFVMMLDKTSIPPKWLPTTRVRFNYVDFGFDDAVGAIRARVQEAGGVITPFSAVKHAELVRQEAEHERAKQDLRSPSSQGIVAATAAELFAKVKRLCEEINASEGVSVQVLLSELQCHLRSRVSVLVTLLFNSASRLVVREYNGKLEILDERLYYAGGKPQVVHESTFLPDLNRANERGWSDEADPAIFLTSDALANRIVGRFVDLDARSRPRP